MELRTIVCPACEKNTKANLDLRFQVCSECGAPYIAEDTGERIYVYKTVLVQTIIK